ncbi:MAG: SAM-dependent methyltransferase [Anaerolineae bacterium]|nr:SAM-dependent methyltransferase [Anaerolineae bacterium]
MILATQKKRIEYGDFQTPQELAQKICRKLVEHGINPEIIIEPTCGVGAFVEAAAHAFPNARKIIGLEINPDYLGHLRNRLVQFPDNDRINLINGDFFKFNWKELSRNLKGTILIVGNFPWVTNSQQGSIGGDNLPDKTNFQNHSGFDAMTGKSNFDISEWMLIKTAEQFHDQNTYIAMLCKTTVARKFLKYLYAHKLGFSKTGLFSIDAKKYFGASVEACLLICKFDATANNYDYDIYENLDSKNPYRVGHRKGVTIRDLESFERLAHLYGNGTHKWRSGIKHDCSEVMELQKVGNNLVNGLGEIVDLENTFLFPLLKGSDIANNRTTDINRFSLVTQKIVGEPTHFIRHLAPKTWRYLEKHSSYLDKRKSKIYKDSPRFSIFGVGSYTFTPWKIAICGLYNNLDFRLIGKRDGKPVVFDDTVYFLSFDNEEEANRIHELLMSPIAQDFLSSLIFWDEKRPIKTSILNSLNLDQMQGKQILKLFEKKSKKYKA